MDVGHTFESEEDPESEIIFTLRRRVDMAKETKVVVVLCRLVSQPHKHGGTSDRNRDEERGVNVQGQGRVQVEHGWVGLTE